MATTTPTEVADDMLVDQLRLLAKGYELLERLITESLADPETDANTLVALMNALATHGQSLIDIRKALPTTPRLRSVP
jgi:hypothetical protein